MALFLIVISVSPGLVIADDKSCENGECIPEILGKLESLGQIYQIQCTPKNDPSEGELKAYYKKNGMPEQCWKYLTEIRGKCGDDLKCVLFSSALGLNRAC
jgi:hypothetical protein